jgi:hypothetical protein
LGTVAFEDPNALRGSFMQTSLLGIIAAFVAGDLLPRSHVPLVTHPVRSR